VAPTTSPESSRIGYADSSYRTSSSPATRPWKAAPLLAALAPAAQAQAPVPVAPGDTLDSPGHYAVTEDHSVDGRLFVRITASDVVLHGGGHAVTAPNSVNTRGILVDGSEAGITNVTVENLVLNGWGTGFALEEASGVTVEDLRVENGGHTGVYLLDSENSTVNSPRSRATTEGST